MNLANWLSVLRILLVPAFVTALFYYSSERSYLYPLSVVIFSVACFTDAMDGFMARRLKQVTDFGTYIDPLADKLLLLSGFLALSFMSHLPNAMRIPAWLTIPVVARDIVIIAGSTMIFLTTGKLKAKPLFIGKITTVSQMASLFLTLLTAPAPILLVLYWLTVILTVASGIQYIRIGGKLAQAS